MSLLDQCHTFPFDIPFVLKQWGQKYKFIKIRCLKCQIEKVIRLSKYKKGEYLYCKCCSDEKLSEEKILEIIKLYENGYFVEQISNKLKISKTCIWSYLRLNNIQKRAKQGYKKHNNSLWTGYGEISGLFFTHIKYEAVRTKMCFNRIRIKFWRK